MILEPRKYNSRVVNSEEALVNYIKRQLGQPMIQIEVPDESIKDIIYESILKFTEYSWENDLTKAIVLESNGMGEYEFREPIREILEVRSQSQGLGMNFSQNFGQGYVPDFWINQVHGTSDITSQMVTMSSYQQISEKYFVREPNWEFSQSRNRFKLLEDFKGKIMIQYVQSYYPEEEDLIYNHPWVKAYSVQRTKFLWGTVTGKYSQSLVGGQQINYGDMKSEQDSEIQKLDEELLEKYTDPQPISIA